MTLKLKEAQSMCMKPRYTVVIPTHRRSILLDRALLSIKQQSSSSEIEIIVISDVWDYETDCVCQKRLEASDIYIKRNGRAGPSASRNLGIRLAKSDWILFLDDDDAWHPNFIRDLEMAGALNYMAPIYVNCSVVKERRFEGVPVVIGEQFLNTESIVNDDIYIKNQIHMSCVVFPCSLLRGVWFDESMRAYEDWDFILSVFSKKSPIHMPILGSRIYEVDDETSDRRGSQLEAQGMSAVLDYLYVYRRHHKGQDVARKRSEFLSQVGISIADELL